MRKKTVSLSLLLLVVAILIGIASCKKKESQTPFNLSTLKAGAIDMNGATPPSNVDRNPTIIATFTVGVNANSVDTTKITLIRSYDNASISLTITVAGSTITIVPKIDLGNGSGYVLHFKAGIKSTDDQSLPAFDRAFQTIGSFVPSGMIAFWNFETTDVLDQVGTYNPKAGGIVNLTLAPSYKTDAGNAGVFDGTTTIVEIPNSEPDHQLDDTHDFTLSFWVKAISAGHVDSSGNPKGHFVLGLGAFYGFQFEIFGAYDGCKLAASYNVGDTATATEDLYFNGKPLDSTSWKGWTYSKDLTGSGGLPGLIKDKWAFITCTYESATKIGTMYINGEKMKSQDFNLWDATDKKHWITGMKYSGKTPDVVDELAFGFIQSRGGTMWENETWGGYKFAHSNHFGGLLDDIRIFHRALTAQEVQLMYNP